MKKILLGMGAMLLLANCSGNDNSKQTQEESAPVSDTVAQTQEIKVAEQQSQPDSLPQDTIDQNSLEAKFPEVSKQIKEFYEGAVLSGSKSGKKIPWTRSALSKYCTKSFVQKLAKEGSADDIDMYGYSTGDSFAVWTLRNPDIQDSDPSDRVLSVDLGKDNTIIVSYLDCGVKSKTKLFMKEDHGTWKINNCKFMH